MITGTKKSNKTDWRWLAVKDKNQAFDGVFYFGVRTTGIFCRPSCSSRTPKPENVAFFSDPAAAESAGFRACRRCHPAEASFPGNSAKLVASALEALNDPNAEFATI